MIHYTPDKYGGTGVAVIGQKKNIFMKYFEELAALPVRYFCNYSLLGAVGIAFEILVFGVRGGLDVSADMQAVASAIMLIVILQTAAEYFNPIGSSKFLLRLGAALVHTVFFSGLILLQLDLDMPLTMAGCLLGLLFWALSFCQIRFPGKGNFLLLPALFFSIFFLLPALVGSQGWLWTPGTLLAGNVILFLFTCIVWYKRPVSTTKKESAL